MTDAIPSRMAEIAQEAARLKKLVFERLDEIDQEMTALRSERKELRAMVGMRHGEARGTVVNTIRMIAPERDEWTTRELLDRLQEECPQTDVATLRTAISRSVKMGELYRPRYGVVRPAKGDRS